MNGFGAFLGEAFSPNSELNEKNYGIPLVLGIANVSPPVLIFLMAFLLYHPG
ncbi:MAG: hypothetical protein AB7E37_03625 [Candidatus Altimarinota bacterium]